MSDKQRSRRQRERHGETSRRQERDETPPRQILTRSRNIQRNQTPARENRDITIRDAPTVRGDRINRATPRSAEPIATPSRGDHRTDRTLQERLASMPSQPILRRMGSFDRSSEGGSLRYFRYQSVLPTIPEESLNLFPFSYNLRARPNRDQNFAARDRLHGRRLYSTDSAPVPPQTPDVAAAAAPRRILRRRSEDNRDAKKDSKQQSK